MAAESSRELVRALYAETIGTFLFQLLGGSEQAAVYNGLLLTVCIVITAKASGGNLNPAVSLALVVVGAMTPFKCALYCLVQVLGQGSHTLHLCLLLTVACALTTVCGAGPRRSSRGAARCCRRPRPSLPPRSRARVVGRRARNECVPRMPRAAA